MKSGYPISSIDSYLASTRKLGLDDDLFNDVRRPKKHFQVVIDRRAFF
jgi:hypothetical protein